MQCLLVYDSQAVMVDQTLYLSGSIGLDPTTANLVPGGIEPETEQVCILSFFSYLLYSSCPAASYKNSSECISAEFVIAAVS